MYRITKSWTEGGVTRSNNPAATYYKDFGSFAVSKTDTWNSVDITDLYKNWKNGAYPNYGIKLVPTNNNHSNGDIASSGNSDSSIRPKLVIVYQSSATTPTPTPTPIGTTAPSGSVSINSGASYTNSIAITLNLSATDDVGVTGYYFSTNSTKPSASDSGWVSVSSTTSFSTSFPYALSSGDGNKALYAWYKDSKGNVSDTAIECGYQC